MKSTIGIETPVFNQTAVKTPRSLDNGANRSLDKGVDKGLDRGERRHAADLNSDHAGRGGNTESAGKENISRESFKTHLDRQSKIEEPKSFEKVQAGKTLNQNAQVNHTLIPLTELSVEMGDAGQGINDVTLTSENWNPNKSSTMELSLEPTGSVTGLVASGGSLREGLKSNTPDAFILQAHSNAQLQSISSNPEFNAADGLSVDHTVLGSDGMLTMQSLEDGPLSDKRFVEFGGNDFMSKGNGVSNNTSVIFGSQQLSSQQVGIGEISSQKLSTEQLNAQQLGTQQLSTQQLSTQQLGAQQLGAQQLGAQQLGAQQLGAQQLGAQQLGTQQLATQQLGAQQLGTQQLGTQQLGAQQLGAQQLGTQQLNTQQLSPQQLSSQQIDTQQLITQQIGKEQVATFQNVTATNNDITPTKPDFLMSGLDSKLMSGRNSMGLMPSLDTIAANAKPTEGSIEELTSSIDKSSSFSMFKTSAESLTVSANARVQIPATVSFSQPGWAGMVADRTAMMASQKIEMADIQLDPPELGPLQIKIHVQNDQTTVSFVSGSQAVRESLEQASHRLKDMMEEQGLNQVEVDVSDRKNQDAEQQSGSLVGKHEENGLDESGEPLIESTQTVSVNVDSAIDDFV